MNDQNNDPATVAADLATKLFDALQVLMLNAELDAFDRQARQQAGDACAAYRAIVEDDQNGLGMMRGTDGLAEDPTRLKNAHVHVSRRENRW